MLSELLHNRSPLTLAGMTKIPQIGKAPFRLHFTDKTQAKGFRRYCNLEFDALKLLSKSQRKQKWRRGAKSVLFYPLELRYASPGAR